MTINLPNIIGHRGVKDLAPENTIPSLEESVRHNLKWIEVDVKVSKDNIPFLLHDDLLDRITSGRGYPYNYLYSEIFKLDAGSWFNKKFSNAHPPTLEEVLIFCSTNKMGINIEIKPNLGRKELLNLYSKSTALIYPSFFESYGLPLVEANHYKLPTIASELDYVRDILDPVETFDPHSAKSICRSVKRFLKVNGEKTAIYAPVDFIKCMIDL